MGAYLLNGHDDLNGIQAVQSKVVGEVRNTVDLMVQTCVSRLIGVGGRALDGALRLCDLGPRMDLGSSQRIKN